MCGPKNTQAPGAHNFAANTFETNSFGTNAFEADTFDLSTSFSPSPVRALSAPAGALDFTKTIAPRSDGGRNDVRLRHIPEQDSLDFEDSVFKAPPQKQALPTRTDHDKFRIAGQIRAERKKLESKTSSDVSSRFGITPNAEAGMTPHEKRRKARERIARGIQTDTTSPDGGPYSASERRRLARHGVREGTILRDITSPGAVDDFPEGSPTIDPLTEGQRRQKARTGRFTKPHEPARLSPEAQERVDADRLLPNQAQHNRHEKRAKSLAGREERERQQLIQDRIDWERQNRELVDDVNMPEGGKLASFDEWQKIKTNFKLVGVDILVGVYKLPEQTARQVMLTLEGTLNSTVIAKNFIIGKDTKTGDLFALPKPDAAKSVTGRLLGALIGAMLPGGIVGKGIAGAGRLHQAIKAGKNMKSFTANLQKTSKYENLKTSSQTNAKTAKRLEEALGSIISADPKDNIFNAALKDNPEAQAAFQEFIKGNKSLGYLKDKIVRTAEDALIFGRMEPVFQALKTGLKTDKIHTVRELLPTATPRGATIRRASRNTRHK